MPRTVRPTSVCVQSVVVDDQARARSLRPTRCWSWSESLAAELDDTPISVTALCPGVTHTDFFEKADAENIRGRQSRNVMSPQEVAKIGYEGMIREELFVIPGGLNKSVIAARRILPVQSQAWINEKQK